MSKYQVLTWGHFWLSLVTMGNEMDPVPYSLCSMVLLCLSDQFLLWGNPPLLVLSKYQRRCLLLQSQVLTWWTTCTLWPAEANRILIIIIIIIVITYIYHVLINTMSAHTIHINLNRIFYKHVEHNPTKTIYIKYCGSQGLGLEPNKP